MVDVVLFWSVCVQGSAFVGMTVLGYWTENCHQQIPRYCSVFLRKFCTDIWYFYWGRSNFYISLTKRLRRSQNLYYIASFSSFFHSTFQFLKFLSIKIDKLQLLSQFLDLHFTIIPTLVMHPIYIYPPYARSFKIDLSKKKKKKFHKPHLASP